MNSSELKTILECHRKWIETNGLEGKKADLRDSDLRRCDLRRCDLRGCNLSGCDLRDSDLRDSDLSGCDLDYSSLPLWCGSLDIKIDKRIAAQIAYHFCRMICDNPEVKQAQNAIMELANQFHRAAECGKIKAKS